MAVLLDQAPAEVHTMAREIMEEFHPELRLGQDDFVRLCILMAYRDDTSGEPSVMCHGEPARAKISIIPYKQRVDNRASAEIIIDQKIWDDLSDRGKRALLDHEITHIEFQVDDVGAIKTDDTGQPKLGLKFHDWHIAGFRSVSQRWGDDALEVVDARDFQARYGDVALKAEEPALFAGQ